jgi:hypothetical protein
MIDPDDDLPQADDAILRDAIRLTDAYERVFSLVSNHPELLPKFDEHWSESLRRSREEESKIGHDPEAFDKETEEEWHRRKEVNLFLRLEIQAKKLVACVRDPELGDVLQLRPDDWIPSDWDDYVPPVTWTDYITPGDYEAPGPNGTFIRGAFRPVFFMSNEFEAWLKHIFGEKQESLVAGSVPSLKIQDLSNNIRKHRQAAVVEAVRAIWGENGPEVGTAAETRNYKINHWLKENNRTGVGEATIRRALAGLRSERR